MAYENLEFKKEASVGVLTINRPQALNALNAQVIKELGEFLNSLKNDKEIRVLIVTGSGKAFVAGADIKEMSERTSDSGEQMALDGQAALGLLEDLPIATIAAVNGFALGGGLELAMACDFIVASEKAKMGLPEVSLGLIPGYGGTQRLSRYVGKAKARLMTLTGDIFTAKQCEEWGLVAMLTSPEDLMPTCMKLAKMISERSPMAIALAKRSINEGFDVSQIEGLKKEAKLFGKIFASSDKEEGVKAFVEKRPPQFTGE
jgi:enoyl-CoA hydratase